MYSIAKYYLLDSDAFLGTETENIEGKICLEEKKCFNVDATQSNAIQLCSSWA